MKFENYDQLIRFLDKHRVEVLFVDIKRFEDIQEYLLDQFDDSYKREYHYFGFALPEVKVRFYLSIESTFESQTELKEQGINFIVWG
jgi:hypothetical protein